MISVEFEFRDRDAPSRLELLVRPIYFIPVYVLFTVSIGLLFALYAANLVLILLFGRRSRELSKAAAIAGGYLAWALSYFWCATDKRPPLLPLIDSPHAGFRYSYKERAYRYEILLRIVLVPIYFAIFAFAICLGMFIVAPLLALVILLTGKRPAALQSFVGEIAQACCQIWCYAFLATDERPLISVG